MVSSCAEASCLPIALPGFGTSPIQSLACRSVVSVLAHGSPVRSNLLAARREIRLIKSLTQITSTRGRSRQRGRRTHPPEALRTNPACHRRPLMCGSSGFQPSVAETPQLLLLIRNQREKMLLRFQMERGPESHPSGADWDGITGFQTLPQHLSPCTAPVAF